MGATAIHGKVACRGERSGGGWPLLVALSPDGSRSWTLGSCNPVWCQLDAPVVDPTETHAPAATALLPLASTGGWLAVDGAVWQFNGLVWLSRPAAPMKIAALWADGQETPWAV